MRTTPMAMSRLEVTVRCHTHGVLCGSDDLCAHYEEIQ